MSQVSSFSLPPVRFLDHSVSLCHKFHLSLYPLSESWALLTACVTSFIFLFKPLSASWALQSACVTSFTFPFKPLSDSWTLLTACITSFTFLFTPCQSSAGWEGRRSVCGRDSGTRSRRTWPGGRSFRWTPQSGWTSLNTWVGFKSSFDYIIRGKKEPKLTK